VVVEVEGAQFAGEVKTWFMRVRVGNTFFHVCQHIILFDFSSDLNSLIVVLWLNSVGIVWFDWCLVGGGVRKHITSHSSILAVEL
jgi:hypothetical protein